MMTELVRKVTTISKAGLCYAIQRGNVSPVSDLTECLTINDMLGMPDGSSCSSFADYMYLCIANGVQLVEDLNA
jgi:hypothetical protein